MLSNLTMLQLDETRAQEFFRTAVLKEYPPAFSAALAGAVADRFHVATCQGDLTLSPLQEPEIEAWVQEALQACAHIRTEARWLPDFQG